MKQSLLVFSVLFLFVFQSANAQVGKGSLMLGGSVGFSVENREEADDLYSLRLNANVAQFFTNRIVGGGSLGVTYQKIGIENRVVTNALSTFRYYFTSVEKNAAFFGQARFGAAFLNQKRINKVPQSDFGLQYSLGVGMSYFILENTALDLTFAYNRIGGQIKVSSFVFNVGFQLFFNNKE